MLNLVALGPGVEDGDREEQMIEGLADHHPSRVVIVSPGAGDGRISAHVEARADTAGACVELIRLELGPEILPHAASAVVPLLRSDLPTYLWWPAAPIMPVPPLAPGSSPPVRASARSAPPAPSSSIPTDR